MQASAATVGAAFRGIEVLGSGVATNIRGNQLPNAPTYKVAAGIRYTRDFPGGFNLVPRADINYTGESWGTIFNKNPIDRIRGYAIVNAQVQFNAPEDRYYVRAFVQNLASSNALSGMYVHDQSLGLFTDAFTIEPRRYGVAAGSKFYGLEQVVAAARPPAVDGCGVHRNPSIISSGLAVVREEPTF